MIFNSGSIQILGLSGILGLAAPGLSSRDNPKTINVGDNRVVSLHHLAQFYRFPRPRADGNKLWLSRDGKRWEFEFNSRRAMYQGIQVWLHESLKPHRRHWVLTESDVRTLVDPLTRNAVYLATAGHQCVVLDPGHGGRDQGATGAFGTHEKDITLQIALLVQARLLRENIQVRLTRSTDSFISLDDRVAYARENKGDLFVSIHLNASGNADAKGTETFVLTGAGLPSTYDTTASHTEAFPGNRYDAPNVIAAFSIQKRMLEYTGNEDRGVRRARFHVLREAPCAAVLLECAFLSHKPEERKLHDTAYLNRMADGLAAGIMDYLSLVKRARLMYDPMP